MNPSPGKVADQNDEVSLREIFGMLWSRKWLILGVTAAFSVGAGGAAIVAPKTYVASAIISPVSNSSTGGGLGALASQFGGLASLAGAALPTDSKKFESLAVLQSEALTEQYIRDNDLLPIIFANKWDNEHQKWKKTDPKNIPTLWAANVVFKKRIRSVANDTKTGLATLTISWSDPKLAAKWANDLITVTNDFLRAKAIQTSEASLTYLNEQALKTNEVAIREGIYNLIQGEINKVMMAKGSEEYALRVVDPAVAPERPYSPQPVAWVLFGFVGGLIVSVIIVVYGPKGRSQR